MSLKYALQASERKQLQRALTTS